MAELLFLHLVVNGQPVTGEAVMPGFKQQIELTGMSWNIKAEHKEKDDDPDTVDTTVALQQLKLEKAFDRSSTLLCRYMDKRTRFDTATITMLSATLWGADKRHLPLLTLRLKSGYVENLSLQVSPSGKSMAVKESLLLSYRASHLEYHPGDVTRGRASPTVFDYVANSIGLKEPS